MEKVTFRPLIGHLQSSAEVYNQMNRDHEMRFGEIPGPALTSWIVHVVEPVVAASAHEEHEAGKIFNTFYKTLLTLFGNQMAITCEKEYQAAWLMLSKNRGLVQTSFNRVFNAVNSALLSIRKYQPERVEDWIAHMSATIVNCNTVEEFLSTGRIYAWLCGMSQLRQRAISDLGSSSPELKQSIAKESGYALDDLLSKQWWCDKPAFVGTAGGFTGLRGSFVSPPHVALFDNQVVATDGHTASALFADSFGSVLLADSTFDKLEVRASASNNGLKKFTSRFDGKLVPFDDVTSSVMLEHTLVVSRSSSFYLYIFGWYA